jgi:glycogen debranching enzyme
MTGGKGARKEVLATYKRLCDNPQFYYEKNLQYYRNLREKTVQINTPNKKLNLAFEWCKVSLDNLIVENPDLGKGMVAGLGVSGNSGRPGFGWFFGGDSFMNIHSINSYCDYCTARDVLAFNQKWQRDDGKIAHELSQAASYVDWWKDYPYGFIHGDTTPYYIAAMFDYYKMSGDIAFIKDSWNSLEKAWDWCLRTDVNGDGLMDNKKAGLASVEYGEFTNVETDIYLASVWIRAAYGMKEMAQAAGHKSYAKKIDAIYQKAIKSFDENLWDSEQQIYSYAFNKDGEHVEEISPYLALGMLWDCGSPERTAKSLEKLNASDITTDWGVRIFSSTSKYFKPLGYNYGCVWPFITMYASSALFRHEFALQGYNLLMATVNHTFDNNLGHVTELYSGGTNIWPEEAVSHQGFSAAGVLMPTVRGLCGLEGNAGDKVVNFEPHFPADWKNVNIKNYRIGQAVFNIRYQRKKNVAKIEISTEKSSGYKLILAPAFGIGTKIKQVKINQVSVDYDIKKSWQMVQPLIEHRISSEVVVCEIEIEPTVELLSPNIDFGTGEKNQGLKILLERYNEGKITVNAEGLAGENYLLPVVNPEKITRVTGGVLVDDAIKISIADGEYGKFVPHIITIETK